MGMISKLKEMNPICRMVNAHKSLCETVVSDACKIGEKVKQSVPQEKTIGNR